MRTPRCDPSRSGGELAIPFKILSRRSWDALQERHAACPGSAVKHLREGTGLYALILPAGCAETDRIRGEF